MNTVPRTPRAIFLFGMILGFTQWGCTRTVQLSDPDLKPFASMYAIDREQFGMTALPVTANVFIERHDAEDSKSRGYSVMLHIYGKAFHHVAFRFEKSRYEWVGEQEQCWGPRDYQTMDGRFKENLTISYFSNVQNQRDGLHISYSGPDHALSLQEQIPIPVAKQMLRNWGCVP